VGPAHLTSEVVDGDQLLRSCLEVAKGDLATRQLVADDHREMRTVANGRLELLAELAVREIGASGDPCRP